MNDTEIVLKEGAEERILEMVREQLQRTNPPSTEALYGRAARIDPAIRQLTLRQFNARYPLRVRREKARKGKNREEGETSLDPQLRSAVREVFVDLARKVCSTPYGPGFVILIGEDIEDYVDRVVEAASRG